MGLSIKNPEVERLARKIALDEGISITEAIHRALKKYEREDKKVTADVRARRERAYQEFREAVDHIPINYDLTDDEILGYDENGLPTK